MSGTTKIEWADAVWNPVTGCTKVSEGCRYCYAERMATRLAGRAGYPAEHPFSVTLHPDRLDEPLREIEVQTALSKGLATRALRGENRPLDVSGPSGEENSPLADKEER